MSSDYSNISQFFSHPLVLLLIGAAISGVLIPYFTNRAANYQKGLEIKTDLVRQINESVMQFVMSLNFLAVELGRVRSTMLSDFYYKLTDNSGLSTRKESLQDELDEIKVELDHPDEQEGNSINQDKNIRSKTKRSLSAV